MTIDDLRAAGITRVRVHYSDLIGTTRAKVVPLDILEDVAEDGVNFCIAVFAIDHVGVMPDGTGVRDEVNMRDMQVYPDLSTLRVVPWERDTAICVGDCHFDGQPVPADPRGILKRAIAEAAQRGLTIACGHELEFFLFRKTRRGLERYAESPGLVYRMDPRVDPGGVLRAMEDAVRGLGLPFVATNQEYDPSQWEINCRYADALTAADEAHLLKLAIKEIAAMHGLVATFMGQPMEGGGTSGYHLHVSARDAAGANAFEDTADQHGLSNAARCFIGGLIEHGRGTTAVMAPTINAYKRYIAKELAPHFIDWGPDNRSVYVRIPAESGKGRRLELRGADGTASPYLGAAVQIFAGLDGIDRKLDPGPPTMAIYEPAVERKTMPFSLPEALDALEADAFVCEKLSAQFVQAFLVIKRTEARRFALAVTDWEIREYMEAL